MTAEAGVYAAMVVRSATDMRLERIGQRRLGTGELRVAVEAVGVNPVDAQNRADPDWARLVVPYVVGYEFAGRVLEVGEAVPDLSVGDAVWGLTPVRGTRWGAYAEEVVVDAGHVGLRPASLEPIEAAALPLSGGTALQILDRLAPTAGEWMLVHGAAGGVGHLLVQLARDRGVHVAAAASLARHAFLESLGVSVIVDRHEHAPLGEVHNRVGVPFPLVADLVGGGLLAASLPLMADGGRAAAIVDLTGDLDEAIDRNITVHGVLLQSGRDVLERLRALVERNVLRPRIDQVHTLAEAGRAHERVLAARGQGKAVLTVADA